MRLLFMCLAGLLLSGNCTSGVRPIELQKDVKSASDNVTEIRSALTTEKLSSWAVSASSVGSQETLNCLYFLNENEGWIGGKGGLYKTTDRGSSWERVIINFPDQGEVDEVFFQNLLFGWVALERHVPYVSPHEENQSWLVQTNDGGRTWRVQREDKDGALTHISFVDRPNGWLAGIRYVGTNPIRFSPSVFHTSNNGENWTDASPGLNDVATDQKDVYGDPLNDWIAAIVADGAATATVLTQRGKILRSFDSGQSWKQINLIPHEPSQTSFRRLGQKASGKLWVTGGADSIEGTWGMLAEQQNGNSWIRYRLIGAYFSDVQLGSENIFIACGSVLSDGRRQAAIFYSKDGGRQWSIIYRDNKVERLNAIVSTSPYQIWAVGERGLIVHLTATTLPQNRLPR